MGIKILIVDDQTAARQSLRELLESDPVFEVVGEAVSGEAALALITLLRPEIVLMDFLLPGWSGIEATGRILAAFPDVRVVGVSLFSNPRVRLEMERAGAVGFVAKDEAYEKLPAAIRRASEPAGS